MDMQVFQFKCCIFKLINLSIDLPDFVFMMMVHQIGCLIVL